MTSIYSKYIVYAVRYPEEKTQFLPAVFHLSFLFWHVILQEET